jgi:hypothetical protein
LVIADYPAADRDERARSKHAEYLLRPSRNCSLREPHFCGCGDADGPETSLAGQTLFLEQERFLRVLDTHDDASEADQILRERNVGNNEDQQNENRNHREFA